MAGTMRLEGTREMERVLKRLPERVAKRLVNAALRKAAKPILDEAQRLAPVGTESKGRTRVRRTRSGNVVVSNFGKLLFNLRIVKLSARSLSPGASAGVAVTPGKAFWGMFQEFGTAHHGKQPFLRPAFDSMRFEALRVLALELRKGIGRELKKLVKPRNLPRRGRT